VRHTTSLPRYARVRRAPSGERGAALILVVFILTVLVGLVASLSYTVRVDLKASRNFADAVQTRSLADAAVYAAMATLKADTDTGQDNLDDEWALLGDHGTTEYPLGDGLYRLEVVDACSRLNLNTATREELLRLPNMTEDLVDAIIDWRDTDQTVTGNGAEQDYYQALTRPYLPKDGPFDSVDELLLVKGFSPKLLYGTAAESPNQGVTTLGVTADLPLCEYLTTESGELERNAAGEARLSLSSVTAAQLTQQQTVTITQAQANAIVNRRSTSAYASVADLLDVQGLDQSTAAQIMDLVTTKTGEINKGAINVNTAPEIVLETLAGVTEDVASSIVSHRPYASIGELLTNGAVEAPVFRQIAGRVCTKSCYYVVRSFGEMGTGSGTAQTGGIRTAEVALVQRTADDVKLLQRREVRRWPGWSTWGWGTTGSTAGSTTGTTTTGGTGGSTTP
jgi:type II secretory pathway component PulK